MSGAKTEGSSLLALILAVLVLLVYQGPESDGSSIATGFAGLLAGAGIAFAVIMWKPELLPRRTRRSARERCEEIRDLLVAEQQVLEQEERRPIPPIRMKGKEAPASVDLRKSA